MAESKIAITERLRRDGRWAEATEFKDKTIARLRADGMKRSEAAEAAWAEMATAFPPSPVDERKAETENGRSDSPPAESGPIPWEDLPTEANFDDEVRWVHQQYVLILEDNPRGRVIHWDRATHKPPSTGACSLARWAAENRTAFYKDLLPKTMARSTDPRGEEGTHEIDDPGLEEVKTILAQVLEQKDAELRANVPATLQRRVNELLAECRRKQESGLSEDSWNQLASGIYSLITDALRALPPAGST